MEGPNTFLCTQVVTSEWEPASTPEQDAPCTNSRTHVESAPSWIRGAYSLRLWGPGISGTQRQHVTK